jgi:hypothetical protein
LQRFERDCDLRNSEGHWFIGKEHGEDIMTRLLPEQESRVETGPTKFGEDWTGIFIRGDHAAWYAMILREILAHSQDQVGTLSSIDQMGLEQLAELLESCQEGLW